MLDVEQIRQMMLILRAEYGGKVICTEDRVKLWGVILQHAEMHEVELAIAQLLSESRPFPPSVGEINQQVINNRVKPVDNWSNLWDAVMKAGNRALYYAEEEAAKLPERALQAIGGIDGLKELAKSSSDHIAVIRGQFRQRLEAISQEQTKTATKEALIEALPNVKVHVKQIG